MTKYYIKQVSENLGIPKDTLRYYDKLGLVCPSRSGNGYRQYSQKDLKELMYIEVMRFSGFTLMEIKQILQYVQEQKAENYQTILDLLSKKRQDLRKKANLYQSMLAFLGDIETTMKNKKNSNGISQVDTCIDSIFDGLREE